MKVYQLKSCFPSKVEKNYIDQLRKIVEEFVDQWCFRKFCVHLSDKKIYMYPHQIEEIINFHIIYTYVTSEFQMASARWILI